jgi:hypothetical protein
MPRNKSVEQPPRERSVSVELYGTIYEGTYTVNGDIVAVQSPALGVKWAQQRGGGPPDALAKILLTELAYEEAERGR